MSQRSARNWAVCLILGALIALLSVTPAWTVAVATATDAPQQVAAGTPVTLSGTGYRANETISVWETGPDGTVTSLPGIQSDANGAFSTSVTFATPGTWQVTAQGLVSGQKTFGTYTVGAAGSATTAPGATSVGVGSSVTFSGTGLYANEPISLWETAPGGSVTPLSGIVADGNGAFTTTVSFSSAGQWEVTARGTTSGKQNVGTYTVGATANSTTPPGTASVTAPVTSAVGPAANAQGGSGTQATVGSPVTFSGGGFAPGETVSLWETGPDSTVTPLSGVLTDTNGTVSTSVTFPTTGYWQVTAQSRSSTHSVIVGFNVAGGASSTTAAPAPFSTTYTGTPIKVASGSLVKFIVPGFNANEVLLAWSTAPDGTVTPLDPVQATPQGFVVISTTFSSAGLWQLTVHSKASSHEVIGQYQVTAS